MTITPSDLSPFAAITEAKATAMIADALAMATLVAPCIIDETFAHADAAKAVIRGAILRWNAADTGAITRQAAGSFSLEIDSTQRRNGLFWPSEIEQLQGMCKGASDGAFFIDTYVPATIAVDWGEPDGIVWQ
ncbi:hypothetical protein L5I01_29695 [Gordonia sp. HY442]|uniref:hypothetical protein n=1 Tax=Gordonia zhenghanii TaxID=2911516 RepID=UPI001F2F89DC|nr:hypothetical protein [Gordonia zhenghanii]MCF8607538.1 hypothetical protein [Gordonia zhenghanii]